jgi:thioredoxin-like negative regulator of GroEL
MISIIDFYANWCNPYKKLEPHLKEIEITPTEKINGTRLL